MPWRMFPPCPDVPREALAMYLLQDTATSFHFRGVECRVIWFNAGSCLRCTYSYLIAAYELISSRLIGGSDQFACQLV